MKHEQRCETWLPAMQGFSKLPQGEP